MSEATHEDGLPVHCLCCGKTLLPWKYSDSPEIQTVDKKRGRRRLRGYDGNNYFCTLRCGFFFGFVLAREGRRVKRVTWS